MEKSSISESVNCSWKLQCGENKEQVADGQTIKNENVYCVYCMLCYISQISSEQHTYNWYGKIMWMSGQNRMEKAQPSLVVVFGLNPNSQPEPKTTNRLCKSQFLYICVLAFNFINFSCAQCKIITMEDLWCT